ncbi:MAG: hypothetical protein J3Q66DRAFT_353271 [Benniella sp.]|nr:MAG: hypothetical protein J3Q66DRAFT_353271 [Benniella sp.]
MQTRRQEQQQRQLLLLQRLQEQQQLFQARLLQRPEGHFNPLHALLHGFEDPPFHPVHREVRQSLAEQQERERAQARLPTPARPGFTKTLGENIKIICPLCREEFGRKRGDNTTLWVIIGCGHVVCGDCVETIFVSKVAIKGRTRRVPKQTWTKLKGKGKARSTGPSSVSPTMSAATEMDEDMDLDQQDQVGGASDIAAASSITSLHEKPPSGSASGSNTGLGGEETGADTSTFKLVKKSVGVCPGCNRKIKKSSIQQLYL